MNKVRKKKLTVFLLFTLGLTVAFSLIIFSLRQNLNVFVTPTELATIKHGNDMSFRLGGMVKPHSVNKNQQTRVVSFIVTDFKNEISVSYDGLLPDLFREGKGVIAEGKLTSEGRFIAANVLAKHDENYMPRSVNDSPREKS